MKPPDARSAPTRLAQPLAVVRKAPPRSDDMGYADAKQRHLSALWRDGRLTRRLCSIAATGLHRVPSHIMSDLWQARRDKAVQAAEPLAARMRPRTLDEFAGQEHILGEGKLLRRTLAADALRSVIFHGPPGTGKTALAEVIASSTRSSFVRENAASVGVKRIREIIDDAVARLGDSGRRTMLFLDEIHRFTRAQQDVLLRDVERGALILIGATTENPMFTVNSALISRSTIFRFEPLDEDAVTALLERAIADKDRGFGSLDLRVSDEAIAHWSRISDGDARRALTALEVAVLSSSAYDGEGSGKKAPIVIDLDAAQESIQHKAVLYDAMGDQHYDAISAMIKSIRGSDPDAAIYWIARMLEGGEDPRFIARRLAILASEDIGNADPRSIVIADACWSLIERIGLPEARITLAQTAIYLALAPKSNASIVAIDEALEDVRQGRTLPVPISLRDKHKIDSEGSPVEGKGYQYSHKTPVNTSIGSVTAEEYLGVDKRYYKPHGVGAEEILKRRLEEVLRTRGKPT